MLYCHLAHAPEPSWAQPGLTEQTSFFLLSICIRSAEGRRRIIREVVRTLNNEEKPVLIPADERLQTSALMAKNPFKCHPGSQPPNRVGDINPLDPPFQVWQPARLESGAVGVAVVIIIHYH